MCSDMCHSDDQIKEVSCVNSVFTCVLDNYYPFTTSGDEDGILQ